MIDPDDPRSWEMSTDFCVTWNYCTVSARSPLARMADAGDIKPGVTYDDGHGHWYRYQEQAT